MKVFLSWSGAKSKRITYELRRFLILNANILRPWMSSEDIGLGTRWSEELESNLSDANAGVLCLTKDNMSAPWILFEAGALSKVVDKTCIIPYLIDVSSDELPAPLGQFQAVHAGKEGTRKLLHRLIEIHPENYRPKDLSDKAFNRFWPNMQKVLDEVASIKHQRANNKIQPTQ